MLNTHQPSRKPDEISTNKHPKPFASHEQKQQQIFTSLNRQVSQESLPPTTYLKEKKKTKLTTIMMTTVLCCDVMWLTSNVV